MICRWGPVPAFRRGCGGVGGCRHRHFPVPAWPSGLSGSCTEGPAYDALPSSQPLPHNALYTLRVVNGSPGLFGTATQMMSLVAWEMQLAGGLVSN